MCNTLTVDSSSHKAVIDWVFLSSFSFSFSFYFSFPSHFLTFVCLQSEFRYLVLKVYNSPVSIRYKAVVRVVLTCSCSSLCQPEIMLFLAGIFYSVWSHNEAGELPHRVNFSSNSKEKEQSKPKDKPPLNEGIFIDCIKYINSFLNINR